MVLDGSLGPSGPLTGPVFTIPAESGTLRGNNLFHSFRKFDLVKGDVADFAGPAGVQNILARVTGGAPSSIDGSIRSQIPGANLFLINPSGIVFGPNASLNISGSFAASTADYLKMTDGVRFGAFIGADDSLLQSAPVASFGFLSSQPAEVRLEGGRLQVPRGKSVSLSGGSVQMEGGTIRATAGDINLAAVQSAGELPADLAAQTPAQFQSAFSSQGSIGFRKGAIADASGSGGGRVVIRGGRLVVENSKIEANTTGATPGRGIDIWARDSVELTDGGQINSRSTAGLARGGNISIASDSIRLDGGGKVDDMFNPLTQISAATGDLFFGGGRAPGGNIAIRANTLGLFNSAQISSASAGDGNAGRIDIEAKHLTLDARFEKPTQITANTLQNQGGGNAGDISLRIGAFELLNGATVLAASFGTGKAGQISIEAQQFEIRSGGVVAAAAFGSGAGGNINVTAGHARFDGRDPVSGINFPTGLQAVTTSPEDPAPGGRIEVRASLLELDNSGSIFTSSLGLGRGGDIQVNAGSLSLLNGSSIRAAGEDQGPAGNVAIRADGPVFLGSSAISTFAPNSSGGDLSLRTGSDMTLHSSRITAQAGLDGGNIQLEGGSLVYLKNSELTAQADSTGAGFGNGGNLAVRSQFFIADDSALVSKSSFGNGGNISILSEFFFPSASIIDASAPFGLPGTVQVTAPDVDLSGVLAVLAGSFLDAATLLRPDCGVRLAGNISSFIILGQGGLPMAPGGFAPSSSLEPAR